MADHASITWAAALSSDGVQTIEDPLHKTSTPKATFAEIYGALLDTLDGSDMAAYFDFYFEASPVMPAHWVFRDEDAREDFVDAAQDEGCMDSLKEVHEGETKVDKEKRKEVEAKTIEEMRAQAEAERAAREKRQRDVEAQRLKLGEKKARQQLQKAARKHEQMLKSLEQIRAQLADPTLEEAKREKLATKAERIAAALEKTV